MLQQQCCLSAVAKVSSTLCRVLGGVSISWLLMVLPANAQVVAVVQNIQPAPLTIQAPYTTFLSQQPAIVTLQINEPASLTVSPPVLSELEDPPGTQLNSTLIYNNTAVNSNTPLNINTTGIADVSVDMQVIRPQPYPADDYTYSVLLTITPQ